MSRPLTLSTAEVAAHLGISLNRFYRSRRGLRATGFPEALPSLPGRYDPLAIEGWIAGFRGTALASPANAVELSTDDHVRWAEIIDQRAERLGRAKSTKRNHRY